MVVQSYGVCSIFFHFIIFLHFLPGSSASYFNCDPVNQGHYCLCAQSEAGVWDIQCPARILEIYPVALKLSISPFDPDEARLRIICDPNPNKTTFDWRLVQGLDFENENISFSVTSLEISYCPAISSADLQNFLYQIKLDPLDIQSFTYQSWREINTFPSDFLQVMPNIEVVDLTNNKLKELPSFQGLQYLNQLNLRGNRLSYIPSDAFSANPHLEQIRLGGNLLSKLNMPIFPNSLILLDLVDNNITTITNDSFTNLINLQVLYMNNNPLQRVESGAFTPLKNLTELSLDYSKLFSLPVLKDLPKLTNLSISYSLFSSSTQLAITTTTMKPGGDLLELNSGVENTNFYINPTTTTTTNITNVVKKEEKGIITMTTSTESSTTTNYGEVISSNKKDDDMIVQQGRSDDVDVETFSAEEEQIIEPEGGSNNNDDNHERIANLYSLKKLILINDDLKSLSWLGYLPNLTDLVLNRNELRIIPEGFFRNLPSILYIDFSKNFLSQLNEMEAPFMTYLDLSNNFLKILDHRNFKYLRQLRVLLLSSNKIEYVHPLAFQNLESLVILDLSNNRISFEAGPPTLRTMMMMARQGGINGLDYDDMLRRMTNSNNDTTIMPTITTMDSISSSNEDEKLEETLQLLPQNHSPLQFLTKVERVNLRNNLINKVFMDWTFVPINLKSLDVSHNKVKSIHPRDLYFVSQDVRFDLRYNDIRDVDMDFAELLLDPLENKNVVVLLDGNPIHCDCHAIAFKNFAVKSYHLQYSDLRCASPENLRQRKFAEIAAKDLRCMLSQSCPTGCSCWELPLENVIKMDCNNLHFLSMQNSALLKNFTEVYEPLEFEITVSRRKLGPLTASIIEGITPQFRFVNLTQAGLTSIDFLSGLPSSNNVTKFALSKNPFKCDGCKFQKIWWKHFRRIVDIRSVTCIVGDDGEISNFTEFMSFDDIVRSTVCSENAISEEIQFVVILLAIVVPVIISTIICITRLHNGRRLKRNRALSTIRNTTESMVGTLGHSQSRASFSYYTPTRSKVVDLDNSKF